ncbi:MAG: AraC family transcriptional regulator, partial [Pseudomonadota bacterium]
QRATHGRRLSAFSSSEDRSFTHAVHEPDFTGSLSFRVDKDRLIEINDVYFTQPLAVSNEVADLISFQFVSAVRRAEYVGNQKHIHDLGPALLVTAIPHRESTCRMPNTGVHIQHVMIYTTLSNLMQRFSESIDDYPDWLVELLNGEHTGPRQRVFFLEDIHRYLLPPCFQRPVTGGLLKHWMAAKCDELLSIGLQMLKNSRGTKVTEPHDVQLAYGDKIRLAKEIIEKEYAHPPNLTDLARRLGISETRLKSGFKLIVGSTVMQYCMEKRIEAARYLLMENRLSIAEIGLIVGYEDPSAFARAFRKHCDCTPREWQHSKVS